jgi:hypothetical protein
VRKPTKQGYPERKIGLMFVHISSKIMFRPVEEKKIVQRELPKSRPKRIKEESKRASINEIIRTGKRLIKPPPRSQHERNSPQSRPPGVLDVLFHEPSEIVDYGKKGEADDSLPERLPKLASPGNR